MEDKYPELAHIFFDATVLRAMDKAAQDNGVNRDEWFCIIIEERLARLRLQTQQGRSLCANRQQEGGG